MKNKLIILLFFLLTTCNFFTQNIRFIYDYRSIQDTLNTHNITDEIMILEISPEKKYSVFSALKKIMSDSLIHVNSRNNIFQFPDQSITTKYIIEKKETGKYLYTPNNSMSPIFKVEDKRIIKWSISSEKKKILSYTAQKATAQFGGRNWIAWFASEIPFSDGPYKFSGLPGLILKISDSDETHNFELIGVKNVDHIAYNVLNDSFYQKANVITIEQYRKIVSENFRDPMREIRGAVLRGEMLFENENNKMQYLKDSEKLIKEELKKDNNHIEKDM